MVMISLWMLRKLIMERARSCRHSNWKRNLKQWGRFWSNYRQYNKLAPSDRQALLEHLYPCIEDDTGMTVIEPTYLLSGLVGIQPNSEKRSKISRGRGFSSQVCRSPFHGYSGHYGGYQAAVASVGRSSLQTRVNS